MLLDICCSLVIKDDTCFKLHARSILYMTRQNLSKLIITLRFLTDQQCP